MEVREQAVFLPNFFVFLCLRDTGQVKVRSQVSISM